VEDDSSFSLKVLITTPEGCQLSDSILVNILNNPVEMPNAFSPNGDSTNDRFFPVSKVPVTILEFKVWNRWGQWVYDNENGINGWDGRQKNEEAAPSDVYVYFVVYEIDGGTEGAQKPLKGDVTLLR
jgi:gliding motility-associated-like protein